MSAVDFMASSPKEGEHLTHEVRLCLMRYSWDHANGVIPAAGTNVAMAFPRVPLGFCWVIQHGAFVATGAGLIELYLDSVNDQNLIGILVPGATGRVELQKSCLYIPGGSRLIANLAGGVAGDTISGNVQAGIYREILERVYKENPEAAPRRPLHEETLEVYEEANEE